MFNMLSNEPRLAMISVTVGDVQYIAEAAPETPHTSPFWTLSRVEQVSATVQVMQVKQGMYAPGVNGAGLATIWGD